MTQYAKIETRTAWIGGEFGEAYARRIFGDAIVNSLPRYSRGKSIGKFNAEIIWVKCIEGGWVRSGRDVMREESIGHVEKRAGKVLLCGIRNRDGIIHTHGDNQYLYLLDSI